MYMWIVIHVNGFNILTLCSILGSYFLLLQEGHTALIASAREGHYEIVRNLLGNGADPNTDTGVCVSHLY